MKFIIFVVVIGIVLLKTLTDGNIIRNKRQSTYDYDEEESAIVFPDSDEETGDRFWFNRRPYKRPNQVQYQYRPQRPQYQYQQLQQRPRPQPNRPQYQQFQQQPQQSRPQYQFQQFQPNNNFQTTTQPPPPATTLAPEVQECNIKCSESVTHEFNPVCGTNNQTYNNRGYLECARRCGVQTQFLRDGRCRPRLRPVS